jgi:hypothetical protein
MNRTKHTLWRVRNGWMLVPEGDNGLVRSEDAGEIVVFRTLKEFADEYPKRERKRRITTKATEPQHTLD